MWKWLYNSIIMTWIVYMHCHLPWCFSGKIVIFSSILPLSADLRTHILGPDLVGEPELFGDQRDQNRGLLILLEVHIDLQRSIIKRQISCNFPYFHCSPYFSWDRNQIVYWAYGSCGSRYFMYDSCRYRQSLHLLRWKPGHDCKRTSYGLHIIDWSVLKLRNLKKGNKHSNGPTLKRNECTASRWRQQLWSSTGAKKLCQNLRQNQSSLIDV